MGQRRSLKRIRKYFEQNKNENSTYQNLWDTSKEVFRRRFIVLNACMRKEEKTPINNLMSSQKVEKKSKMCPKQAKEKKQ